MTWNLIDKNMDKVRKSLDTNNTVDVVPEPYIKIADRFREVKDSKETLIVEEGSFPYTDSTVMFVDYVSDRWVGGYSLTRHNGEEIKLPKTIHYSDIYVTDKTNKVKIIFEGAHPYVN